MKTPAIQSIEIKPVSFALKNPFVTAAGHKNRTDNVQIALRLSNGIVGRAEASSSIAMPGESSAAMQRVLQSLIPELRGRPIGEYRTLVDDCWRQQPYHPTATAAMECALIDAFTKWKRQPLYRFLGDQSQAVETDFTLSVGEPGVLAKAAKKAAAKGFKRLKVKLSGRAAIDLERIRAVHQAAPHCQLVADGNQGFSLSQALLWAQRVERDKIPVLFLEQPFPRHDLRAARLFRGRQHLPIWADESVRNAAEAVRVLSAEAADGVNVKIAKSGLLGALDIIRIAKRFKKKLGIGCMEESKLGLAASVHLACGAGVFDWVDLDSVFLLDARPVRGGFSMQGPKLSVKGIGPGIGL